jgi:multidrug efflux pump subunit AcrB
MIISDTAVKNRVSVIILAIIILIVGVYCYLALPREAAPDVTIPNVFVSTNYRGVAAADIETSVTIPIEKKLKGLEGIKKIHSISSEGLSQINIEFTTDTEIDDVLQKVKDKVDEAKNDLPSDLDNDPKVFEVNISEFPIVVFSLSGTCGITCLKEIADDLEDEIEAIQGVLEVDVTGGLVREVRIEVDAEKLAYYRIPITSLQQVVHNENINTSGGSITLGDGRYQLRVPGEFERPDEIFGLVVSTFAGRPVYLKDLARVVDGFKDEASRSRLNGRVAINLAVKKRAGENIITITEQIDDLIENSKPTWPQDTRITKMMDQAKDIRLMVADLENNILSGLILVVIVLLFVMGFRNAVLVGLAIPFSLLLSFAVLYALGITLNMVVLFSLTLALGMLVDNAIVIVENIYRYMEQGVPRTQAAMRATAEVAYPVIGSTLTTLAAFFPLIFWPGIMGEFMYYLPLTLVVTLTSSLFVALIINPALCSIFLRVKDKTKFAALSKDASGLESAGEKPAAIKGALLKFYAAILRGALNHRLAVTLLSFAALILLFQVWLLFVGLERPVEFFPSTDPRSIYVNIDPPEGANLAYTDQLAKTIEMKITGDNGLGLTGSEKIPDHLYQTSYKPKAHQKRDGNTFYGPSDLNNIYSKTVQTTGGLSFGQNLPNHIGVQFIDFIDRKDPATHSIEAIRKRIQSIAGARITITEQEDGPPTGMPVNIEISGDNYATLGLIAKNVRAFITKIPFVEDVQDDYVEGIPSIQVKIDRQKAAIFGLNTNVLGFALKIAYNGLDVSTFREGDKDYDITVTLPKNDRMGIEVLRNLMIPTTIGTLVPLTTLARIDYTGSIGDISRINHKRTVTVKANVDETKIPGTVARAQAEKILKQFTLPPGYQIKFTGEFESQQEAQAFLGKAFLVALFLIFLILVTLFNSAIQPIIIMTSVILSLGGAFLGLTVIKAPFGIIMSGVGVISLAGVVVNNAIVLIDYTNKLRQRGMQLHDALVAAGATRLRPVLLTAITTILGLLPMVTGKSYDFHKMSVSLASESTQFWQNMAIVVIFGLMIATFLTLIVVPTLYSLLVGTQQKAKSLVTQGKKLYWKPFGETP